MNAYASLWEVESAFRTLKDVLEIRPIFYRKESHVKGDVFCSYLTLCLLIALQKHLREHSSDKTPACWDDVIRDLRSFRVIKAEFSGKNLHNAHRIQRDSSSLFFRKILRQAVGLKAPPVLWKISYTKGEM
jgi:hypothetical protein